MGVAKTEVTLVKNILKDGKRQRKYQHLNEEKPVRKLCFSVFLRLNGKNVIPNLSGERAVDTDIERSNPVGSLPYVSL